MQQCLGNDKKILQPKILFQPNDQTSGSVKIKTLSNMQCLKLYPQCLTEYILPKQENKLNKEDMGSGNRESPEGEGQMKVSRV